MMFGLLGFDAMANLFPKYGLKFVNTNLNFNSLTNSWMTLFAVGTGNYYSEIISRLISDPNAKNSLGIIIFIELFFLIFYLCFYLVLKSFTIQIIIRYESYFGSTLGIASQQITVSFHHTFKVFTTLLCASLTVIVRNTNPRIVV